jgi:uncharacterized phage-associated protein
MTEAAAPAGTWVPTSAAAVGNTFLKLGWQDTAFPPIDQMKLQKLLFYAHAWYLAYNDRPLFAEDVEAWPWGPVVRPIYYQTRNCRKAPISSRLTELRFDPQSPLQSRFVDADVTDPDVTAFLDRIWDVHKPYTGIQLSNSTHAKGEPWTIIKDQYGSLETKPVIPNDLIAAVYRGKLGGQTATA